MLIGRTVSHTPTVTHESRRRQLPTLWKGPQIPKSPNVHGYIEVRMYSVLYLCKDKVVSHMPTGICVVYWTRILAFGVDGCVLLRRANARHPNGREAQGSPGSPRPGSTEPGRRSLEACKMRMDDRDAGVSERKSVRERESVDEVKRKQRASVFPVLARRLR